MYTASDELFRRLLGCPTLTGRPFLVFAEGRLDPDTLDLRVDTAARTAHLTLTYSDDAWRDDIFVTWDGADTVWQRRSENRSGRTQRLVELGMRFKGIAFGPDRDRDFFYHPENPRLYQKMTIPVRLKRTAAMVADTGFDALAGTKWADPGVVSDRVGASPYQPFPAVLLGNDGTPDALVHGTLAQRVFFHNHLFSPAAGGVAWEALSSFKAVAWREVPTGTTLEDCWYLGRTAHADDVERLFEGYLRVLRRHLPPLWGARPINRHSAVWGSWNDGICRDIDEPRLLQMADFIRDELPTVEWMQVDDGYGALGDSLQAAHGLGVPYEGAAGVDARKFPRGLRAFTDAVRERGLKPAIWIGGLVPKAAPLHRDHPDWFFDYDYRVPASAPLDVSKTEARACMRTALDVLIREGGFDAVKLDFWSYAFEDSHPLLAGQAASGYEWRTWWLSEIRRRLPAHGYLQTGCDIAMGNPFLGEFFTNYRYGIDIGSGNWDHIVTNFLWGTACFATHGGDLIVPNSDAIGLFPGLSDSEAQTCITYCLISRSLVEVAGWLCQHRDHPRLAWVKKALCCPNNGQDVFFADYDYRRDTPLGPPVWFLRTPHFSLLEGNPCLPVRTVAVFNLQDEPGTFGLTPAKLRLLPGDYVATDVWTLASADLSALAQFQVGGRGSRLFAISRRSDGMQALDANIKVDGAWRNRDALCVRFAHRGDLELAVSAQPSRVTFEGRDAEASIAPGGGNWVVRAKLPAPGVLQVG